MSSSNDIEVVHRGENLIGECPLWHPLENRLYWIDTRKPTLQRLEADGSVRVWQMPEKIGSFVFRRTGGLLIGLERGFCLFDLESERIELIADPEPGRPDLRLNDGKCDPAGRYWAGSLDTAGKQPLGSLFRLDRSSCTKMDTGFIVSNGMAFSPDGRTMIFGDSTGNRIYRYDFDAASGEIANKRVFIDSTEEEWLVDGATFDTEGFYWAALVKGGLVGRFDPDGRLERTIAVPVMHPTMCNFGGENLDILYVTSGTLFLDEAGRREQPLAGALFAIHGIGARGFAEPLCSL